MLAKLFLFSSFRSLNYLWPARGNRARTFCEITEPPSPLHFPPTVPPLTLPSAYLRKRLLPAPLLSLYPHRLPAPTRVSTAPVEHALPPPDFDFNLEISRLASLRSRLAAAVAEADRLAVLDSDPHVRELLAGGLPKVSGGREVYLLKCLVAAGQGHVLGLEGHSEEPPRSAVKEALFALAEMIEGLDFGYGGKWKGKGNGVVSRKEEKDLNKLLKTLEEVERFYDCIGGIIGSVQRRREVSISGSIDLT